MVQFVIGKWEAYQPDSPTVGKTSNPNLSKFMQMCQEISAKEGDDDDGDGRGGRRRGRSRSREKEVHHPFQVSEAPMYMPSQMRKHAVPTVGFIYSIVVVFDNHVMCK